MGNSSLPESSAAALSKNRQSSVRKHWYVEQKEEMKRLATDARSLEIQLARLTDKKSRRVFGPKQQNAVMRQILQTQQNTLWNLYSLLSNRLVL